MSSTVPSSEFTTIESPIRNGSLNKIKIPESRFWKISLNAKPMATEPIPSALISWPGVNPGIIMTRAIKKPKNKITVLPTRFKTKTRF